jgi:indolepyruvate ferredoxin oxidoreductase beta subunit
MGENEINVIIGGVGGQGNILASQIVAQSALIEGKDVIVGEVFGVSMRGGSVVSHVRIGNGVLSPISPEQGVHVICGLEPMETLRLAKTYIRSDGIIITNTRPLQPIAASIGKTAYPPVKTILASLESLCRKVVSFDTTALAIQAGGAVATNMVLVGALSASETLNLSVQSYEKAIRQIVPRSLQLNLKAFHLGRREYLSHEEKMNFKSELEEV